MATYLYLVAAHARLLGDPVEGSLPLSESWQVVATTQTIEREGWHAIPDFFVGVGERCIAIDPYEHGLVAYTVGTRTWYGELAASWIRRLLPLLAESPLSEATDE